MTATGIISLTLIAINVFFTYMGLTNQAFFDKFKFEIDRILNHREYYRFVSSGFLHINWMHLIFNMLSLYLFGDTLELYAGPFQFILIYFVSLVGGNLLALLAHRNHGNYSAVGSSGAVCGIIFASIALFPHLKIGLLFLPIYFPSWLYGLAYVGYTIYAIRSGKTNVGHEAHLGGALVGMILAIALHPAVLSANYIPILLILVPSIAFIIIILKKPELLLIDNLFFKQQVKHYNIDHKFNEIKVSKEEELNKLLDKIHRKGINSLSRSEKAKLEELAK